MSEQRKGVQGVEDWICSDPVCKNVNYARRTSCHRCQLERKDAKKAQPWEKKKPGTEIGKQAAEKSRGLFSAEDWQCSQCANINWSRRNICNMCNAPKFTHKNEERTGTGGGFNDRVTVEYKEKVESDDDEYDEFGRRKKIRGAGNSGSRHSGSSDEEEESGDEEDLSKYNLWDSDDNGEPSAAAGKPSQEDDNNASTSKTDTRISPKPKHSPRKRRKSSSSASSTSSSSSSSTSSSFSSSNSSPGRKYRKVQGNL